MAVRGSSGGNSYRWAVLAAGTAASTAFSAVLLGLPVLAPVFREEFDLTLTEVGIVLASVWVGPIFTLLPWGLAADRFGERRALAVGLTAMGIFVGAGAAVDDFYVLVGLLGLASAAGSSVNSASGRAVMHWFAADERGFALGLRQASLPLGGALAAVTLPPIVGASSLGGRSSSSPSSAWSERWSRRSCSAIGRRLAQLRSPSRGRFATGVSGC